LQVRYHLDELVGTSASDSSGNSQAGTLTNGAVFSGNVPFGGGVELEGVILGANDFIDCHEIDLTDGASALTIAFWLNSRP
jgi:hypothetical protein